MIKTLLTTAVLTFSQVNFSNTPFKPQIQESNSQSVVQEGIANYDITLQQVETTPTAANTNYSVSYKRTYQEQNDYLYVTGEQIYYDYYKIDGEDITQNPQYTGQYTTAGALPYIKVDNWSGTPKPNVYYYTQWVIMLQITPYHNNTNNEITSSLNITLNTTIEEYNYLAVPPSYTAHTTTARYINYDIFTSTANLSNYLGSSQWSTDGYVNNMLEELTNSYTYGTTNHKNYKENYASAPSKNIDFTIMAGQTNYLFLFITPSVELDTQINYPIAHTGITKPMTRTSTIHIIGTGIIPTTSYEVVDIPSIMFEVVGMPFYFISTAFNLTLFAGTPYQINISSLFLSIFAVLVFIFLLRLLLKVGK